MAIVNVTKKLKFKMRYSSFYTDMTWLLILLEYLWVFPLKYVREKDCKSLRFDMYSWQSLYSLICAVLQVISFIMYYSLFHIFSYSVDTYIAFSFFALECSIQIFYFTYLASKWPLIARQFQHTERTMKNYEELNLYPTRLFKIFIAIGMIYVLVYYILNVWHYFLSGMIFSSDEPTIMEWFTVIFISIMHLQKMFILIFKDMPIIFISIYFAARLRQIRKRILFLSKTRIEKLHLWRATRQDYANLARLCDILNSVLGLLIVVSYLFNIVYLLTQGFVAISFNYNADKRSKRLLSFFKLTFMFLRISLLCFYGGSIHHENENILDALISVPSDIYNSEVERFLCHAASGGMVLTGMNFFKIRRSLLLRMANSLVTYELVIIQFVENFMQLE